jgi:carboxypeptidase Taq
MGKWLGLETTGDDRNGCMQDVHWPSGAFGYFPTYTLGAMIAAQLAAAFKREQPAWNDDWRRGDFSGVREWLSRTVWSRGSRLQMKELVAEVTGAPLDPAIYLAHLRGRYLG